MIPSLRDWMTLYPFESRWMMRRGGRIHYIDEGEGPTLLFVHGPGRWSFHWRELILAFRGRYRTIAPDHTGCGFSDIPRRPTRTTRNGDSQQNDGDFVGYRPADRVAELVEFVRRLKLHQVTLIADQWACATGLAAAMRIPQRFARFVLINPPTVADPNDEFHRWPRPAVAMAAPWILRRMVRRGVGRMGRTRLNRTVLRGHTAPYSRCWIVPVNGRRRRILWQELHEWRLAVANPAFCAILCGLGEENGHKTEDGNVVEHAAVFTRYPACRIEPTKKITTTVTETKIMEHIPGGGVADIVARLFEGTETHWVDAGPNLVDDAPATLEPILESFFERNPAF